MRIRGLRHTALAALSLLLGSCAVLDNYSTRAIDYNIEAEDAGNQALLLNIVRASLHRPMQFTDVQNIVGSTTAGGSLGFAFPLGPMSSVTPTTGTSGSSLGGATTFTIPVLNTQEFYQGILRPFPSESIDYFLKGPNAKNLMLNLLFERIAVKVDSPACANSHLGECERDFRNAPYTDVNLALFQSFMNFLIDLQISTEPYEKPKPKEPEKKGGGTIINVQAPSAGGEAAKPDYRVCFANRRPSPNVTEAEQCGGLRKEVAAKSADTAQHIAITFAPELVDQMLVELNELEKTELLRPDEIALANGYRQSLRAFKKQRVQLTLQPRSTYDVFRYLGELVERRRGEARPEIVIGSAPEHHDYTPCWLGQVCGKPILVIDSPGQPAGALAFVAYAGTSFSIPGDPAVSYGPDVLAILKELIALNTSSKSLPTTAVLSLATAR